MLGKEVTDEELYDRVLCMEQIMSTGGGWQDQVGGLAPGIKMVSSEPAIRQRITCVPCKISEKTRKELDERFCLIYSGQRRLARNLLRGCRWTICRRNRGCGGCSYMRFSRRRF